MALTVHKGGASGRVQGNASATQGGALVLMSNPTKPVQYQPVQGPQMTDPKPTKTPGAVEANIAFDKNTFNEQRTAF